MASYIMVRIEIPSSDTVAATTQKLSTDATKPHEGVRSIINILEAMEAGAIDGNVVVATRDSTESISASGSGSASATFNLS